MDKRKLVIWAVLGCTAWTVLSAIFWAVFWLTFAAMETGL
jgi:hypothetical protein